MFTVIVDVDNLDIDIILYCDICDRSLNRLT